MNRSRAFFGVIVVIFIITIVGAIHLTEAFPLSWTEILAVPLGFFYVVMSCYLIYSSFTQSKAPPGQRRGFF
jgi:uncharacterized oligopeptide transporter (OPT) family protein